MSRLDRKRRKYENEKSAKALVETMAFKESIREFQVKATTNAIGRLAFIACEFLENTHGYKKAGLQKFLKYLLDCIKYTEFDDEFFLTQDKYYKETYGLDVLAELGLRLEVKE